MTEITTPTTSGTLPRVWRFLQKPWQEKTRSFYFRWIRIVPGIPVPIRLPFGGWWLARNDYVGASLLYGELERNEYGVVKHFLRPGMTFLDVGAHQGYYTLLASRAVGSGGRVLAFEPSPRERNRLRMHLRLNRCKNVEVEDCALGDSRSEGQLHVVLGTESGCNSLRKPNVQQETVQISVRIEQLDWILRKQQIDHVDFVKLDVEGAELSVLKGAADLLQRRPRPVMLVEVQDVRTKPWGYSAKEILHYLANLDYAWFAPLPGPQLHEIDIAQAAYDGNFVAVPEERIRLSEDVILRADRKSIHR